MKYTLIADSGSTKTQWRFVAEDGSFNEVFTQGINPYFMSKEEISALLIVSFSDKGQRKRVDKLYFYGAGCSHNEQCVIVKSALEMAFPKADIRVASDLLASAKALFGSSKGVACILGTGSNAAVYNGIEFTDTISSLGYILGDEGSGAYIGKKIITAFFHNELPLALQKEFQTCYTIQLQQVLNRVYKQDFPNRYLAGFAPFAAKNLSDPLIYSLVYEALHDFVKYQLASLSFDMQDYKIGFVGSVAFYFRSVLESIVLKKGYILSGIIAAPMDSLVAYHHQNR